MGLDDEPSDLEDEPSALEAGLEEFRSHLEVAVDFVTDFGAETPLQNVPGFEDLVGEEDAMMEALNVFFGVDRARPHVVREYMREGTPGHAGQGQVKVRVIATNVEGVYIGESTFEDGVILLAIRPLEVEE
jgi:hypothetical protein